jgi:hypothetical protein
MAKRKKKKRTNDDHLLFVLYSENLLDSPAKNTQEILPEKKIELVTISQ